MLFEHTEEQGRASASGRVAPEAAGDLATVALAKACAAHLTSMLVDFSGLSLTRSLTTTEAYELGKHLARAGFGLRRVAFVMAEPCIEVSRFALAVAGNRGLAAAAFSEEREALQWLQAN